MATVTATFWNENGDPAASAVAATAARLRATASSISPRSIARFARHSISRRAKSTSPVPRASVREPVDLGGGPVEVAAVEAVQHEPLAGPEPQFLVGNRLAHRAQHPEIIAAVEQTVRPPEGVEAPEPSDRHELGVARGVGLVDRLVDRAAPLVGHHRPRTAIRAGLHRPVRGQRQPHQGPDPRRDVPGRARCGPAPLDPLGGGAGERLDGLPEEAVGHRDRWAARVGRYGAP